MIYCFAPQGTSEHGSITVAVDEDPYSGSPLGTMFRQAAETILNKTQVTRGYCLVLGCRTGQLALELARRSELMIYVVEPDARNVAAARKMLSAAGVYGSRVCVDRWPLDKIPYADYFANLIVSESAMVTGQLPVRAGSRNRKTALGPFEKRNSTYTNIAGTNDPWLLTSAAFRPAETGDSAVG